MYGVKKIPKNRENDYLSEKIRFKYTGSCIIAYQSKEVLFNNSDFLEGYLDYDKAYELYFENGVLKEKIDLNDAIKEFREIGYIYNDKKKISQEQYVVLREKLAYKYLKYSYGKNSYKWRHSSRGDI